MNIRSLESTDLKALEEIHGKFFNKEFELPDFSNKYICALVIEDKDGIIAIGGVRAIAECVMVTDKDRSARDRREALYKMLHALVYFTKGQEYDQIHAFIQDPTWSKQLQKIDFHPTKGQALVLDI